MVSYLIFLPLMRNSPGVSNLLLLYITLTEVLAISNDADTKTEGVQMQEHEIKL